MHRRLNLTTWEMEVRVCLVFQQTVVLMVRLGDNEVTMVTMRMVKVNTEVRRRRVAAVVMLGRASVKLSHLFMFRRVVLSRGRPALTIGSEVDTVAIVVVEGIGSVTVSLLRLLLSSRRPPWGEGRPRTDARTVWPGDGGGDGAGQYKDT